MEHNAFFRIATLKICGNLKIEAAMRDCIGAINDHLPVDRMFLQIYEPSLGAMRTIAMATVEQGRLLDVLTPLPRAVRDRIHRNLHRFPEGAVIIDSPERNPVAREMLRFHGTDGWSVMRMTLSTEAGRLGAVVLTAEGADRYDGNHVELLGLLQQPFAIALANTLDHREVLMLRDRLADDNQYLRRELHKIAGDEIVGADFGLKSVMRMVRQVAPTESPVLLTGETGVGKDVVAQALHQASARCNGPFIAVNCGAIPETLLDSELFGHEKGAFTGALAQKRGRFERADQGTIFLDEIGEMPLTAQVRLLRVLQHREIERVGGAERIPVDIRIIAATNKNLEQMVKTGTFREDLWFRLNVFPIPIPPLKERSEDIPALVQHFVERKAHELKLGHTPVLAPGEIEKLITYTWPGNVRELENLIERAMILCRGEPLRFELRTADKLPGRISSTTPDEEALMSLDDVIERHIRRALERTDGQIHGEKGAGRLLGINPNTLRHRMRKLGILFNKAKRKENRN